MTERLTVFLFVGPEGPSPAERWVAAGRMAAAQDAIHLLARLPAVAGIVVATPERAWAEAYPDLPVTWDFDPPGAPFHFGHRLASLLQTYPARNVLYLGAGSLPLLAPAALAEVIAEVTSAASPLAITNNVHSSDWMAFNCPGAVRARPDRLISDNALGWVLRTEAGVEVRGLPPSAATRLDIDTPADLLLLGLHPGTGPALARFLSEQPQDHSRWRAAGRVLFTPAGQVALIGRVSSGVWAHVEAHTQAWIRVFSEERGMAASGRLAAGQVRSWVGAHLARVGPATFLDELSQMVDAAFFDTRVVLAHEGRWPPARDRYASDLYWPGETGDAYLRALTAAALDAPIPIVLGGHGVVAGDLYGLVEVALAEGWIAGRG